MSRGKKQEYMCAEHCCRNAAFSRRYELERHKKSKHNRQPASWDKNYYRVAIRKCGRRRKWSRSDRYRLHTRRVHPVEDPEELLRRSTLLPSARSGALTYSDDVSNDGHSTLCLQGPTGEGQFVDFAGVSAYRRRGSPEMSMSPSSRARSTSAARSTHPIPDVEKTVHSSVVNPIDVTQPIATRASTPSIAQWQEQLDKGSRLLHPHSASVAEPDARRTQFVPDTREQSFRSHPVGNERQAGSSRGQYFSSGSDQSTESSSSWSSDRDQVSDNSPAGDVWAARGRLRGGTSASDNSRIFPCVFHEFRDGVGDPDVKCKVRQRYVSKLFKHHQIRSHPHGPFFCCTKCFREDFVSEQEMNDHKSHGCNFLCVTEGCCNFDRTPNAEHPCDTHAAGNNSQKSMWNKLYRVGRQLPPDAPVPDLDQAPTTVQPAQPPQPVLTIHTPTPTQNIDWQSATPAPYMVRSASAATGISTYSMSQQHTPQQSGSECTSAYNGVLGITPSPPPSYSSLGASNRQAGAADVERSLEGLARTMWRQVCQPRPTWSLVTCGWYTSAIQNLTRSTPYSRITMLQTLVEACSVITENSSQLALRDWEDICDLTRATLPAEHVPEDCPWVPSSPGDPAMPSLLSVTSFAPSSSYSRFDSASSYSQVAWSGSNQSSLGHAEQMLLTPMMQQGGYQNDLSDVMSQFGSEAPTTYDRVHTGLDQVPAQDTLTSQNMPSDLSDPTYASASEDVSSETSNYPRGQIQQGHLASAEDTHNQPCS